LYLPDGTVAVEAAGKYVKLEDTIRSFQTIIAGEHDELPESAFYRVGTIDDAVEKARAAEAVAA